MAFDVLFPQRLVDPFFDRPQVRVRLAAAQDQIIDQFVAGADVQDPQFDRLLILGCFRDQIEQRGIAPPFNCRSPRPRPPPCR